MRDAIEERERIEVASAHFFPLDLCLFLRTSAVPFQGGLVGPTPASILACGCEFVCCVLCVGAVSDLHGMCVCVCVPCGCCAASCLHGAFGGGDGDLDAAGADHLVGPGEALATAFCRLEHHKAPDHAALKHTRKHGCSEASM